MSHGLTMCAPQAPLVVQVGFAGSRILFDPKENPQLDEATFHQQVEDHLVQTLNELPAALGLTPHHFLCGISSLAIGADTLFAQACARATPVIKRRVLLPEHREAFLSAKGSDGTPDFSPAQAGAASALLQSSGVIESRVVSHSSERNQRFADVNLEIVRISDICIALTRVNAQGKPGGTRDFIDRARARHRFVLEITVSVRDGQAHCENHWQPHQPLSGEASSAAYRPPTVPAVIAPFHYDPQKSYVEQLKSFSSQKAEGHQGIFRWAAFGIIGTHVAATIFAAIGVAFHQGKSGGHSEDSDSVFITLLTVEIIVLFTGFVIHWLLHRRQAVEQWATARLISEVCRSVSNASKVRRYLAHLFALPFPESFRPLLRTLNFYHLQESSSLRPETWPERRDGYLHDRLDRANGGQISYYTAHWKKAECQRQWARAVFYCFSICAIAAASLKLLNLTQEDLVKAHVPWLTEWTSTFAFLAIVLPVVAVAALSLVACFDIEARLHTYAEMVLVLEERRDLLLNAASEREFENLVLDTEARLVGENVAWFSRRVFTGVT